MEKKNSIFIAKSLDGFIADKEGGIEWLNTIPNPNKLDLGYNNFIQEIEALIMGRVTFEKVLSFNIPWPYTKPVFVVSNSVKTVPAEYKDKVQIMNGSLTDILEFINGNGFLKLYIDGGSLMQSFLKEDLIDEMIISTIPLLLGSGIPLFGEIPKIMEFEHVRSEVFLNAITQDYYKRKK